MESKNPAE